MDSIDIAAKRDALRAQINQLISEFIRDTRCTVEIELDTYHEVGKLPRPIVNLKAII